MLFLRLPCSSKRRAYFAAVLIVYWMTSAMTAQAEILA